MNRPKAIGIAAACLLAWPSAALAQLASGGTKIEIGGDVAISRSAAPGPWGPIVGVNPNDLRPVTCVQRKFDPSTAKFAGEGRRCGYGVKPGPDEEVINIIGARPCGGALAAVAAVNIGCGSLSIGSIGAPK